MKKFHAFRLLLLSAAVLMRVESNAVVTTDNTKSTTETSDYDDDDDDDDANEDIDYYDEEHFDLHNVDLKGGYIYDRLYDSQVSAQYQFRDCIDHRDYCTKIRHLCHDTTIDDSNINMNTNDSRNDSNSDERSRKIRWVVAHCPRTCNVCDTHQTIRNVPYQQSIAYEIERRVRLVPNEQNSHSKINPYVALDTIRDAMTGTGDSKDAIGVQYLMSTTAALQNGVTYEQRNNMMQHIKQTQRYYTTTVVPNIIQNSSNATLQLPCRNASPYCTYWAVIYDRCNDSFYRQVMNKHCPVTCQRCHEIINNNKTTAPIIENDRGKIQPNQTWKQVYKTDPMIVMMDGTTGDDTVDDVSSSSSRINTVFDSEHCIYDPELMPNLWYPNTHVNKLFERIVHSSTSNATNGNNPNHYTNSNKVTVMSQPLIINKTTNEQRQQDPWLIYIDDFLSDTECAHLIQLGNALGYKRSTCIEYKQQAATIDGVNAKMDTTKSSPSSTKNRQLKPNVTSDDRTSSSAWCHFDCSDNDASIQSIYHRVNKLIQVPTSHYEALQLLQYQPGEYDKSHYDYIPTQRRSYLGPRILTILMYLSDVQVGGATQFPFLNATVSPKRGRVVLWSNVLHTQPNVMDLRMIHRGLPVITGTKYAANLWIHQRELRPSSCYIDDDGDYDSDQDDNVEEEYIDE